MNCTAVVAHCWCGNGLTAATISLRHPAGYRLLPLTARCLQLYRRQDTCIWPRAGADFSATPCNSNTSEAVHNSILYNINLTLFEPLE